MKTSLHDYCLKHDLLEILMEWAFDKNGEMTPKTISYGSKTKAWWRCKKGHEWLAQINSRVVDGNDCPYCGHRIVSTGETDLAILYPEVLEEWAWDKNGSLKPDQVTALSNKKAWWRCELGHEWSAVIASRTVRGARCPYCSGKKVLPGFNDLETKEPIIASQWHPTLNGDLTPNKVSCGSKKRVWWQCADGHVWNAVIYSRATGKKCGCPVCAGNAKKSRTQV